MAGSGVTTLLGFCTGVATRLLSVVGVGEDEVLLLAVVVDSIES